MAMVSLATSSLVLIVKEFKKPGGISSNKLHSLQAPMLQTILSCELHSFLSVPILHTHQVQYSTVQYSTLHYSTPGQDQDTQEEEDVQHLLRAGEGASCHRYIDR